MAEFVKSLIGFSDDSKELVMTSAAGASDYFTLDNADHRVTLIVKNANSTAGQDATVTLKAGNGILSTLGDEAFTVPMGKTYAIPLSRIDSARIKNLSGTNKGKVMVSTTVAASGVVGSVSIGVISVA
ncbi:MAG TPA: hypothetical protein VHR42_06225 [Clostridia bacterium]|nr:hypothetical protein [Clostridia bacterium]